jgi:hypothetical protein
MRLQHVAGIQARKEMFLSGTYNPAFNFVVRDLSEAADGSGPYEIVDGAHRFAAACQLVEELGYEKFINLLPGEKKLTAMVLHKHTPKDILVGWANYQNETNNDFFAASFIDHIFSTWKFMKSFYDILKKKFEKSDIVAITSYDKRKQVWVEEKRIKKSDYTLGYVNISAHVAWAELTPMWKTSVSDIPLLEKYVGIIRHCISKQNNDLLDADLDAHKRPNTPRTMFMEALLFERLIKMCWEQPWSCPLLTIEF